MDFLSSNARADQEKLEMFFLIADSGKLFESHDPVFYRKIRTEVRKAFFELLVFKRPFLETTRGLNWPYDELKRLVPVFEDIAKNAEKSHIRREAGLFLSLLPFPGQWRWLIDAENNLGGNDEIKELIYDEQKRIMAKLEKKRQKTFRLRHFCQILKKPNLPHEKGVLRIFSLPYLFADRGLLKDLNSYYFLYVEPPWGVLARHFWLRVFSVLEDPVLFGLGGKEDRDFIKTQKGILTTSLAHGDFLKDIFFSDSGKIKKFDIVFNATYDDMERKRHDFLLKILSSHPGLRKTTALFLGRGASHNVDECRKKVWEYNLEKRVSVLANVLRKDIPPYLAECKIGVQVSLHENVCRSIYEYFRSNLPCVVTSSMAGFDFRLINSMTGEIATDSAFPETLIHVIENYKKYSARKWFKENSGPMKSSKTLNDKIRRIFTDLGYKWSEDIVPLGSSGANRYIDQAHYRKFFPQFEQLFQIFTKHDLPVNLVIE